MENVPARSKLEVRRRYISKPAPAPLLPTVYHVGGKLLVAVRKKSERLVEG
jgi:hypothetical protein